MKEVDFLNHRLRSVRRLVVKVGTNLLRGPREGLNQEFIASLARQISKLREGKIDVILVSSGAVGAGAFVLGYETPPAETALRQALAAIGQSRLMHHYEQEFARHGVTVAQVLLTRDHLDDRRRYLNARNTFDALLAHRVVPIVNENDTVAVEELKFGDNDQLSALIAGKIGADLLVILTDVQGIFDRDPSEPGAVRIPFLRLDDHSRVEIGEGTAGSFGLGGMRSKLEAARLATRAGILTFIGPGRTDRVLHRVLHRVLEGEALGTWCEPERRISARKRWLALGKRPVQGKIRIDSGAEKALRSGGKSLLPSGVRAVEGEFERGDLVCVVGADASEIAIGLTRYSSIELESIKGRRTGDITPILGDRQSFEVIHRDDMVVTTSSGVENG